MTWFNKFNKPQTIAAPSGEKEEYRHEPEYNEWNKRVLKRTKIIPIYDIIQSHADECNFEKIIRRATEGDTTALNIIEGQYIDITEAPKNIMEAQNIMLNAKKEFENLPADTRKKFDYDYHNYMGMMLDNPENFAEITGLKAKWEEAAKIESENAAMKEMQRKAIENLSKLTGLDTLKTEVVTNGE